MSKWIYGGIRNVTVGSLLVAMSFQPIMAMAKSDEASNEMNVKVSTQNVPVEITNKEASYSKLVPLRAVLEAIGGKVEYNGATKQVIVSRGPIHFVAKLGEREVTVNGDILSMRSPLMLSGNSSMIQLDEVRKVFQANVDWDKEAGITFDQHDVITAGSYFIHLLQIGKFASAQEMMNETLKNMMSEQMLGQYWTSSIEMHGDPTHLKKLEQEKSAVHHNAVLSYETTKSVPFDIIVRFDNKGKIDDIFIPFMHAGPYKMPEYDEKELYTEEEIVIGQGNKALPGTLTLPTGKGPFPVVVLVHGSGPHDRDYTFGGYKGFRDLAVGLAAKNIAVLRYEKQTQEHTIQIQNGVNSAYTVKEETVDDAIAAIKALQMNKQIDSERIYVLGHSQGGMLIPRIIESDDSKSIAGSIIMSAPSKPIEDVLLDQYKYDLNLAKKMGEPTESFENALKDIQQQVALIKEPQYSVNNLPPGFTLTNPIWWFDFRNYHGGEIAKNQTVPLLILHGGSDIYVDPANLDGWKQALSARQDVMYKLYPELNHFYFESDAIFGKEFESPVNVPAFVIDDIADWISSINS